MSARQQIVDVLRPALPASWDVLDHARDLGNVTAPTVMVETTAINYGVAGGLWSCTTTVYVVAPYEDPAAAEAMLEDGTVTVLNAMSALPYVSLGADRVTLASEHHAFRVQITYPLKKADQAPAAATTTPED